MHQTKLTFLAFSLWLFFSFLAYRSHGALNPGGLASDNYDTVFFDMEFYMEPALLWWW